VVRILLVSVAVLFIVSVAVVAVTRPTATDEAGLGTPSTTPATDGLVGLSEPSPPADVLVPATSDAVTRRQIQHALNGLLGGRSVGPHLAVEVEALGATRPLLTSGRPLSVTPASTIKLLTTAAALEILGPEHRFDTTVVAGAQPDSIVLVGGGDPLLTDRPPSRTSSTYPERATLSSLARQTARSLRHTDVRRVTLGYDASLFSGPAVNPRWPPSYTTESIVSPITALWVDEGRAKPSYAQRVTEPAAVAARRFAALLAKAGIRVSGQIGPQRAPDHATTLGEVESAPLAQIVQYILELSDNEGAEVLLRQAAIGAGKPGSFTAGVATVRRTLASLGIDLDGDAWYDGSGLSRSDRISVSTLVAVLQLAASSGHPELRTVVATLPVAGFTGSLAYRFVTDAPAGLGVVRAKTGTLARVHALAGIVVNSQGVPLVFAAVADQVPVPRTLAARAQLDRIAAALASS
jgi:D-alanyl-D-alanine carboxypeptidase/D-alanyl-D-alanine-endopeptidase (penicillin-binding protein 4)